MKAVVYQQYGDASVLHEAEQPEPNLKANELLLAVKACEVTKADIELRNFKFPVKWFAAPMRLAFGVFKPQKKVLGSYVSGKVLQVGDKVSRFKKGDEVFGCTGFRFGGYGERLGLPEHYTLAIKPQNVSHEQASSALLGGLNAVHFLRLANLQTGQRILVNGGGGSIGLAVIQLAKAQGAHVTAVDAPHKQALLAQAGADETVDFQNTPLTSITEKFDVVFNVVAGMSFKHLTARLTATGTFLTANPKLSDMWCCKQLNRRGSQKAFFTFASESQADLQTLRERLSDGSFKPIIDGQFERHQIQTAHDRVETESRLGAVVLVHPS